jgi:tRNA dimethylallyltransferase
LKPLLCIVGPTASGKSALALSLAQKLNGEIVSCDSMQLFRECDLVTAKPSLEEQGLVKHHLLDILNPNEHPSAANWARRADAAIKDIQARGQTPIVCGGTGFYLRALLQPQTLAVAPPDADLRAQLQRECELIGAEKMHERLARLNPEVGARLHSNDTHRVLRALEVQLSLPAPNAVEWPAREARVFCLDWPRELLVERINTRIEAMIEAGALDETRALLEKWGEDAPALGGVGYKQLRLFLKGECDWKRAVELWQTVTRQYSKRQGTWFRGQTEAVWLDATRPQQELVEEIIDSKEELAGMNTENTDNPFR